MTYSESFQSILARVSSGELQKPIFDLTSVNGNAFSLMGGWGEAARKAKWPKADKDVVIEECMASESYDQVICILLEVSGEEPHNFDEDDDSCGMGIHDDDDDSFIRKHYNPNYK